MTRRPSPSAIRQPIHGWINGFLKGRFREQDGRNTVFVLSDAGMGKSSLLMMLKLSHLSRFWPSELADVPERHDPERVRRALAVKSSVTDVRQD